MENKREPLPKKKKKISRRQNVNHPFVDYWFWWGKRKTAENSGFDLITGLWTWLCSALLLLLLQLLTYVKIFIESWKSPLLNFPMVFRVKRAKKFVKMMCGWQKHEKFRAHMYDAAKGICQKNGMSSFFCSDMPHQNCFEDIPILKKFNENLCSRFTLWILKLVVYTWINSLIPTYFTRCFLKVLQSVFLNLNELTADHRFFFQISID